MHDQKLDSSVLVLALLLALFSSPVHSAPPATPGVKAVVAKVGERPITREDILHTMQIEKFYKSPELSEADALVIIMQDAIAHEVAHSVGVDVTPRETPVNFPFVKQFTPPGGEDFKSQETLPPQEQAFHVNDTAYAQLYVVPKIINRKLRRYFNTTADIHTAERTRIEQAQRLVISGKSFADAANATGLMTARLELESKAIEVPAAMISSLQISRYLPQNDPIFDILNQLAPGAIHPNTVEDDDGYRVLRLIARNDQKYTIEIIEAAKSQYDTWLRKCARALRITISDDALKRDIKRDYPDIDWVKRL
ncbi:MAG TPA: hypothetical protein VIH29_02675 [Gallionella sp.]